MKLINYKELEMLSKASSVKNLTIIKSDEHWSLVFLIKEGNSWVQVGYRAANVPSLKVFKSIQAIINVAEKINIFNLKIDLEYEDAEPENK